MKRKSSSTKADKPKKKAKLTESEETMKNKVKELANRYLEKAVISGSVMM
jgi:hypothetical protein